MGFGIVFDIDGVLLHGKEAIPAARTAMDMLHRAGASTGKTFPCPAVCLTNAGYVPSDRVDHLNDQIDARMDVSQLIVSHSPVDALLSQELGRSAKDARILLSSTTHDMAERVARLCVSERRSQGRD